METGHIYPTTSRHVYLASGVVDLIDPRNPRKRTRRKFSDILVQGDTDEELRKNFFYEKAFPWDKRKTIRELQDAGLVVLVELKVGTVLGLDNGIHPIPDSVDVNDQLI